VKGEVRRGKGEKALPGKRKDFSFYPKRREYNPGGRRELKIDPISVKVRGGACLEKRGFDWGGKGRGNYLEKRVGGKILDKGKNPIIEDR